MVSQIPHKPLRRLQKPLIYSTMILAGLFTGWSEINILHQIGALISDIFIKIFQCISLPIISLSIIVTLSHYESEGAMSHLWKRVMCYTFGTTLIAAIVSFMLYVIIKPQPADGVHHVTHLLSNHQFNYLSHLSNLVPKTFLSPFIQQQVISVLLLSIIIGFAIRNIPNPETRQHMREGFQGLHAILMVITHWVIRIIPLALFGFISVTTTQMKHGMALSGIGEYLTVVVLANLIQGLIILPLWLKSHGLSPFLIMKKMSPALSLAFFSKSSVGTLPVTMRTAESQLNINPELSRFLFPLCTSLNMNGCAAFIFATVVYLMENNGIHLSYPMMGLWVIIATISAIGNAGVPMGCFFLSASLLSGMNVPITLMGIILPFYSLIDMLETCLNVWSDSSIVTIVDHHARQNGTIKLS